MLLLNREVHPMRASKLIVSCLVLSFWLAMPALASTGEISNVIEVFIAKQFPQAQSHFWVVNGTEWGAEDEVVVDVNTMVVAPGDRGPTENRFLLLIVRGQLVGAQSIPLGVSVECKPDEIV